MIPHTQELRIQPNTQKKKNILTYTLVQHAVNMHGEE